MLVEFFSAGRVLAFVFVFGFGFSLPLELSLPLLVWLLFDIILPHSGHQDILAHLFKWLWHLNSYGFIGKQITKWLAIAIQLKQLEKHIMIK